MGIYIFNTSVLFDAVIDDAQRNTSHDFGKNIIPELIDSCRVCAYNFKDETTKHPRYWRDVGTLDAYYEANLDLLGPDSLLKHDGRHWPIQTGIRHWPPVKALSGTHSLVSRGSVVRGGYVFRSVLSRGVVVDRFAEVQDSILMEGVRIGRGARVRHAIIEDNVGVPPGTEIGYDVEKDRRRFLVTENGIVVIPTRTHIHPVERIFVPRQVSSVSQAV